jgi:hypothetical protein
MKRRSERYDLIEQVLSEVIPLDVRALVRDGGKELCFRMRIWEANGENDDRMPKPRRHRSGNVI